MTVVSLTKVVTPKAVTICEDIDIQDIAKALLNNEISPIEYLNILIAEQLYIDAIRFMARALPKREAVWWAWSCARHTLLEKPAPEILAALSATENWVRSPTEANRRLANTAAQASGYDQPVAWAATAAFWSEGNIAPENVPAVPPADNLTAKAVAGAVILAAVYTQPEKNLEKYQRFLEEAIDIGNGGNGKLWRT